MIKELLTDKTVKERAEIKSAEIAKLNLPGEFQRKNIKIEIVSLSKIEGGLEIFVRAWDKNGQIGFGPDGSVDIERFRIYNPPILVEDPGGEFVYSWIDEASGEKLTRTLKEDPREALLQTIEHTISVKKEKFSSKNIKPGKIGSTTSTFYPAEGANTPVDGKVGITAFTDMTWATIHNATNGDTVDVVGTTLDVTISKQSQTTFGQLQRAAILFDTSPLSGATISSATLSLYGSAKTNANSLTGTSNIFSSNPASTDNLVIADYSTFGTTAFSTAITYASWSTAAYNDFILNASGLAAINQTGISKFGYREATYDAPNNPATGGGSAGSFNMGGFSADQTGTTNDPMLVVESTGGGVVSAATVPTLLFMGVA